jgi:hypothetical protein
MAKGPQGDLLAAEADMVSAQSMQAAKKEEDSQHPQTDRPMENAPSYSQGGEEDINYKNLEWW